MTSPPEITQPTALYRHFAANGTLLYVGITGHLSSRVQRHKKKSSWWPEVDKSQSRAEWFPNRELAASAEKAAIKAERPKHNKAHAFVEKPPRIPRQSTGNFVNKRRNSTRNYEVPDNPRTDRRMPPQLSLDQAAHVLGVVRQYAHRMARDGRLPGQQVGKTWVFRTSVVLRIKAEREQGKETPPVA